MSQSRHDELITRLHRIELMNMIRNVLTEILQLPRLEAEILRKEIITRFWNSGIMNRIPGRTILDMVIDSMLIWLCSVENQHTPAGIAQVINTIHRIIFGRNTEEYLPCTHLL
ncbi:hypothetical protein SOVF_003780 [Spinacia oleracea]|nr:hypothetical protein SOVF_003780 [Spinacia oleracea]